MNAAPCPAYRAAIDRRNPAGPPSRPVHRAVAADARGGGAE